MDVRARIVSYHPGDEGPQGKHRFGFELSDSENVPYLNSITARTAKILTKELILTTAFGQMIQVIAATEEDRFEELVGRIFGLA
jgi:hypothetical protein